MLSGITFRVRSCPWNGRRLAGTTFRLRSSPWNGPMKAVISDFGGVEGLDVAVHAAVFRWRMENREGVGAYELWVRSEPAAA